MRALPRSSELLAGSTRLWVCHGRVVFVHIHLLWLPHVLDFVFNSVCAVPALALDLVSRWELSFLDVFVKRLNLVDTALTAERMFALQFCSAFFNPLSWFSHCSLLKLWRAWANHLSGLGTLLLRLGGTDSLEHCVLACHRKIQVQQRKLSKRLGMVSLSLSPLLDLPSFLSNLL